MLSTQQSKDYGNNLFMNRFRSNCPSQKSFLQDPNLYSPTNQQNVIIEETDVKDGNDHINWGLSNAIKTLRIDNVLESLKN